MAPLARISKSCQLFRKKKLTKIGKTKAKTDNPSQPQLAALVRRLNSIKQSLYKSKIIVKKGETLNEILARFYGRSDTKLLSEILKLNPEIKNPDFILEIQIIRVPVKAKQGMVSDDRSKIN